MAMKAATNSYSIAERLGVDITPERKEGEDFKDYKARQKQITQFKKFIKSNWGIRIAWNSAREGTFDKRKGHRWN